MEFDDKVLKCMDCGQDFVFTKGEQEFYVRKGFKEDPKRCKTCREARKSRSPNGGGGGDRYGGGGGDRYGGGGGDRYGGGGGDRYGGGGDRYGGSGMDGGGGGRGPRGDRPMYDATCGRCGSPARVPFRPTPGRPVFCRTCFQANKAGGFDGDER